MIYDTSNDKGVYWDTSKFNIKEDIQYMHSKWWRIYRRFCILWKNKCWTNIGSSVDLEKPKYAHSFSYTEGFSSEAILIIIKYQKHL